MQKRFRGTAFFRRSERALRGREARGERVDEGLNLARGLVKHVDVAARGIDDVFPRLEHDVGEIERLDPFAEWVRAPARLRRTRVALA